MAKRERAKKPLRESFWVMFDFVDKLIQIERFFATRRVIHRGEALYLESKEEIERRGLLGPWAVNLYESLLVALPSSALLWIVDIFYPLEFADHASRIAYKFSILLSPAIFPFSLLLVSFAAGWGSLYGRDMSSEKREVAQHAYLYFDGCYGLWPQMLSIAFGSLSLKALEIFTLTESLSPFLVVIFLGSILGGFIPGIWTLILVVYRIPSKLFKLNGYTGVWPPLFLCAPKGAGPWTQYQIRVFVFAGFLLWLLNNAVQIFCGVLGIVLGSLIS
ncbi:hypothetical protein [Leptothoe sp. PORK10 BA2]|uniref:hypothetical protein n=1 Tax=Leptothoe sp. PORK10 BA2 TaxID=3110254 RepID=UPI002B20EAF7|nr:hypothetical protein [Leptothoe sp. PORK10 BA2]MEA5464637.1 hypothetical protein [Leptothoe sp. PORK10 BA2]